jgi:hypothetical protein
VISNNKGMANPTLSCYYFVSEAEAK